MKRLVSKVIDGDTFKTYRRVNGSQYIRLAGVNAPEKGERGYMSAKQRLQSLNGKVVNIHPKARDCYGRTVADVTYRHRKVNK